MSVFTPVSREALAAWLNAYDLGALTQFQGIAAGVENSNFFVSTRQGDWVLTLFERHTPESLAVYLAFMAHLATRAIPCPAPVADRQGQHLGRLCDRPAALFTRLAGRPPVAPSPAQCAAMGQALARLHLAARDFHPPGLPLPPHCRDQAWRLRTGATLAPRLPPDQQALLARALAATEPTSTTLPRGLIHADLFRDNTLFQGDRLTGILDFYFAGVEDLIFDLAVVVNDWCLPPEAETRGQECLDPARLSALFQAYRKVRPLSPAELADWPRQLRAAALRFWLSRLEDALAPRPGELVTVKDPEHFRRLLVWLLDATPASLTPAP